jgi:hypothetical protein
MFNKKNQNLISICVAFLLVVLAIWNASLPVDTRATSYFIAQRPEGKLVLEIFDAFKKGDIVAWKKNHSDPSNQNLNPEEFNALQILVETYIKEKKLTFVEFTSYNSKVVDDKTQSRVTGWFKSEAEADLYVKLVANFSTVNNKISIGEVQQTPISGKLDFSTHANALTFNNIWKLSLFKLAAIFLALICLCLSGIVFTVCILNWKDGESKLWSIPVLFGVVPIKIQMVGSGISWKIATFICPPGWLGNAPFAFGGIVTYDGQSSSEVGRQIALISLPIALFYFLRRTDKNFNDWGVVKTPNKIDDAS